MHEIDIVYLVINGEESVSISEPDELDIAEAFQTFIPSKWGHGPSDISLIVYSHSTALRSRLAFCLAQPEAAWATYSDGATSEVTYQGRDQSDLTFKIEEGCGCLISYRMDDLLPLSEAIKLATAFLPEGRLFIHSTFGVSRRTECDLPDFIRTNNDFPPIGVEQPIEEVLEFCRSCQPWSSSRTRRE